MIMSSEESKRRAILSLNNESEDLLDLDVCLKLQKKLLDQKTFLLKEVSITYDVDTWKSICFKHLVRSPSRL